MPSEPKIDHSASRPCVACANAARIAAVYSHDAWSEIIAACTHHPTEEALKDVERLDWVIANRNVSFAYYSGALGPEAVVMFDHKEWRSIKSFRTAIDAARGASDE